MSATKPLHDSGLLFFRSLRDGRRDPGPAFLLPAMPPVLMVIVFNALFERITERPGFPTDEYIDYLMPGALVLTALLGAGFTATHLVNDLTTGYAERLRLLPAWLPSLFVGRLGFEALRVLPAAAAVLGLCLALGAPLENGAVGVTVALLLTALLSAAFAGLFFIVGLATRDPQTPLALQPLGVLIGLMSTALVPASVMPNIVSDVARLNPASVVVRGARSALEEHVWSPSVLAAFSLCVVGIALTQAVAGRLFTSQLTRG